MLESKREPATPALFADFEHDGRVRPVVTDCSYSTPPQFGEDRATTGIYVADNTCWKLFRPAKIGEYVALVRRSYRFQPDHDELLPVDSERWRDQGNSLDPHGPTPAQVRAVLAASPECRGVRLPIVNGRVERLENDPCDVNGKDRIELSNGTVCLGWPTAVIDGTERREIVADQALYAELKRIADEHRSVVFAGQSDPQRCSPTIVWAMRR